MKRNIIGEVKRKKKELTIDLIELILILAILFFYAVVFRGIQTHIAESNRVLSDIRAYQGNQLCWELNQNIEGYHNCINDVQD